MDSNELERQQSVTDKMRRIREPHRTYLFTAATERARQVVDRLGSSASRDDLLVEMYLVGLNDGSNMQKQASGERRQGDFSKIIVGGQP